MRRIISLIILAAFAVTQTADAYAQQAVYPAPAYNTGMSQRPIRVNGASAAAEDIEKERAMVEAIFEAEYKQAQADEQKEHLEELRGPMKGIREQALEERYLLEEEKKEYDLRHAEPVAENGLRKIRIKREIPPGADLGKGFVRKLNEGLYPIKVSGDYQLAWGYDWGSRDSEGRRSIWKNADFNKANMVYVMDNQYVFGTGRENTYDKRIYDRFHLKVQSLNKEGFNFLSETVVDPWSFVGKTDPVVIGGVNDQFPLELRYWSNTQSTLDERIWLNSGTDFINIPELKVEHGRTNAAFVTSTINRLSFVIPELEIHRDFRPLRKLEANYKNDLFTAKVFPLADQDHVLTTDDPLVLSNNHIYWEPSPWLDRWDPAFYFTPTGDYTRGAWRNDISFESRDSDYNFLTLLRGLSFELNYKEGSIAAAAGIPLNPWQNYDSVNSLPGALRIKQKFFDNYYLGGVYSANYGYNDEHLDAFNNVVGIDAGFEIPDFVALRGEFAASRDRTDWRGHDVRIPKTKADGNAFRIETKGEFLKDSEGEPGIKVATSYTHMGDSFRNRLSNYRNTRSDQNWGKHISFHDIAPDFDAFRVGNGVDIGRNVYHMRVENRFYKDMLNSLFDARFVRMDTGGNVENVYREEITFKPFEKLTTKLLYRYQGLPRTTHDTDSFIIADYISADKTDTYLINRAVDGGEDPSVWTFSLGSHADLTDWLAFEEIFERTNDYDIFPQLTLNDANILDLGNVREYTYFLYGQGLFDLPPYDDYSIYKSRVYFTPVKGIRTKFEYVYNAFKHATGRDDNISHWGAEIDVDFTEKLSGSFKLTRSQLVDLQRQQIDMVDVPFNTHTNIFAALQYAYDEDTTFVVLFGEFFIPEKFTPVTWLLNTVDTQKIVRFYLKGKF